MYYEIILLDAVVDYDRPYIYKSDKELERGQLVFVPFGIANKPREGLVLGPAEAFSGAKNLIDISQIFLNKDQLDAGIYLAGYYGVSLAAYLRLFLPRARRVEPRRELVARDDLTKEEASLFEENRDDEVFILEKNLGYHAYFYKDRVSLPRKEVLSPLYDKQQLQDFYGKLPPSYHRQRELVERLIYVYPHLLERSDESLGAIKSLESQGVIKRLSLPVRQVSKYRQAQADNRPLPKLDYDKAQILEDFLDKDQAQALLIRENVQALDLYINIASRALEQGRRFILVYPDASMIPGVVEVFKEHFGERVGVYHGKMTPAEEKSELLSYMEDAFPIMITSRMGLFLPLEKGDYLVVEEAQDDGYQSANPYYHGLELASYYGRFMAVRTLFASSAPGLSLYLREDLERYHLKKKLEIETSLVDMRQELLQGNNSPLSRKMVEEITRMLDSGGLGLLLMNRRHYANYIFCRSCGHVLSCPQCEKALYYNQRTRSLFCPSCNYRSQPPRLCPQCGSRAFRFYGGGIEMVYSELKKLFPQARIILAHAKTMESKDGYIKLHRLMRDRKVDLVVGTNLISRGLDYQVDFLGVVNADFYLHIPTYRASEKGYQMLKLFLERARPGSKAIIQSYEPKNYVLQAVLEDDSLAYLEREAQLREARELPPFIDYLLIRVYGQGQQLEEDSLKILEGISHLDLEISPVFGQWLREERRILVKGYNLEELIKDMGRLRGRGLKFSLEVDPQNYV